MKSQKSLTILFLIFLTMLIVAGCSAPTTPSATDEAAPAETDEAGEVNPTVEEGEEPAVTDQPTESASAEPRVLTVATTANITTWDPIQSFSTEAFYMAQFYEQLLRINPPGSDEKFTPLLAESWEPNEDGTQWTFHLREGVTFHDGEPLTAEAVKMSIEAAQERAGASFIWLPLESIDVVDDLTVQFNLSYAAPLDLIASSLYGAWIVSPKALEAAADDPSYFEQGIAAGTGPYMLDSYTPDAEIVLTANPNYWGGWDDSQYNTVLLLITPDDVQQQQMLEGGEVDLASRIPPENVADFAEMDGFTVIEEPSFFNYVGLFNTLRPPLDNPLVRQALSYATLYEDIIQIGAQGFGTQSHGPVPAGVFPFDDSVMQYETNMDKARELLAEAGYPDGGFELRLTYAAENPVEEAFAPLIRDAYAELGIDVTIEPILFNQQWEEAKADPANAQDIFLLLYWPTYSDAGADNLWSLFHSSEAPFFNLSYWKNEEYDGLIDEASTLVVSDPERSQELYTEAMNLLVEEAPGVFYFDTMFVTVIPDHIKGYQYNLNYPFVPYFFYELSTDQ